MKSATIIKRWGIYSTGPYRKEDVIIKLVKDDLDKNFVNSALSAPEYVKITPINYNSKVDTASADFDDKRIIVHSGETGRQYLVEIIGF